MPNEPKAVTLCDNGEEPSEIMVYGHVSDEGAKQQARDVMADESYDDIEETLRLSSIVQRHTKWMPASEGSPHDEIAQTCDRGDAGAFAATHVIFP